MAAIAMAMCLSLAGICLPSRASGETLVGKEQQRAVRFSLVGNWAADVGKMKVRLKMTADGRFVLNRTRGEYSVEGNVLKLRSGAVEVTYQFQFAADKLTLSGGDLAQPLEFARQRETSNLATRFLDIAPGTVRGKLYRILLIIAVALACRIIITLLRVMSRFAIYSERGPLKFLYRDHKNRAMTLHSLALNVSKYIVYFAALGFILTELGVNYTAYLASLSVIGLAIGFGSQGLVQDMVTGFFIIFEGQFDVGDMVEIPPHTGIVEELGLRMTKLRNYLGQIVVIPNRNIATVGNYAKGAQEAYVDVAMNTPEAAREAVGSLERLGGEVARQFKGVILAGPEVLGPMSLATDEHFVRLHVSIWPQQQWVIEGQLVPRIREMLKRSGFEVPGDRIAIFYHSRVERPAPTLRRVLKKFRRRQSKAGGETK